jgi:hypothetical protein
MVTLTDLKFPIIYFNRFTFYIEHSADNLTITTKAGLKNRLFENLTIIDSNSKLFQVKSARKLHGIGPLWGYNIFLNQKIKIELSFSPTVKEVSLSDLKSMILKSFAREKHFWESRDDFNELIELVKGSDTIQSLIAKLGDSINAEYKI